MSHVTGKLPLAVKILSAGAVAGVVAVVVGLVGIASASSISDSANEVYSSGLASVASLGDVKVTLRQARIDLMQHAIVTDPQPKQAQEDKLSTTGNLVQAERAAASLSDLAGQLSTLAGRFRL